MTPTQEALRINVLFFRAQQGLSQAALAEKARVNRTTVSFIENGEGNVTLFFIERIAKALGVAVHDLFEPIATDTPVTDDELLRRAADGPESYVDGEALLNAIDESNRYSPRGRRKKAK